MAISFSNFAIGGSVSRVYYIFVLIDSNHSSRRSQAVLLRNGNEAIFRLESSIAQTCKTNKQKISIYHLGRLQIFMHELRKHLVY